MAADEATKLRIQTFLQVLESAVTAALPLITIAVDVQERTKHLYDISNVEGDLSMTDDFLQKYREVGVIAAGIEPANSSFRNALEILELDMADDYGMSVSVAATMIANFVVRNAALSDCTPEEVWQEYVLRGTGIDGFI